MTSIDESGDKLLFVGGGNIACAVACGLVKAKAISAKSVTVYDIDETKFFKFRELGINTSCDLREASVNASIIFIAVKPNIVETVIKQLSVIEGLLERAVIVSFAAAVPISFIEKCAGREVAVIRTMPSTPVLVGEGVIAASKNELVSKKKFEHICRLLSSVAYVVSADETMLNPVISINGSSPAYVYLFVKAMLDGAAAQGINRDVALPLILKTIKGSIKMIESSETDIDTLIKNVASPNGTTLAALNSLENDGFVKSVTNAMQACTKRADEISESL